MPVIGYRLSVLKLFAVHCLLFTVFTGCAPITSHVQKISDEQDICLDSAIAASLQRKSEVLKTLKGSAEVKTVLKDGREITGRGAVLVKRPGRFRLEISGPFNQTAFVIIYNGKELSLFSFQENRLYRDYLLPVEASLLPQYLLGLPAGEVISRGGVTPPLYLPQGRCYVNLKDERILINRQGDIKEIILSEAKDAARLIKVSMDFYKETDGFNFPFAISIHVPEGSNRGNNKEADIFIRYDHIELNRQISDDLFNPLLP